MTIEQFQLLAWLRVGEAVASVVLYAIFIFSITKVYKKAGVSLVGIHVLLRGFFLLRIFTLLLAVGNLSETLIRPEEAIQQYIEQQSRGTFGSLFDVPEELICGEKSSAG